MKGHLGRASRRAPNIIIFYDGGLPRSRSLLRAWNRLPKWGSEFFLRLIIADRLDSRRRCCRGLCDSGVLLPWSSSTVVSEWRVGNHGE
jgi:hypothetical protein